MCLCGFCTHYHRVPRSSSRKRPIWSRKRAKPGTTPKREPMLRIIDIVELGPSSQTAQVSCRCLRQEEINIKLHVTLMPTASTWSHQRTSIFSSNSLSTPSVFQLPSNIAVCTLGVVDHMIFERHVQFDSFDTLPCHASDDSDARPL